MSFGTDVPLAPPQPYEIRRYRPGDGPGVAYCFRETYGDRYQNRAVYEPDLLDAINGTGTFISFVAVAQNGEIAGHYALRRDPQDAIAEGCAAAVAPQHSDRHLMTLLRTEAEREAQRLGLPAYYTEPVTDHIFTQRASEAFGAHPCAISLGIIPKSVVPLHMQHLAATNQRLSLLLYVKPLAPVAPRTVVMPSRHREMIERIFASLGAPLVRAAGAAPSAAGSLRAESSAQTLSGTIFADRIGGDIQPAARQAVADLRKPGNLGALFVMLPLDDPGCPLACDAFEDLGFFFSGVAPWMLAGRDALRLQLPLEPIDCTELALESPFAKELVAYADAERKRCERAST